MEASGKISGLGNHRTSGRLPVLCQFAVWLWAHYLTSLRQSFLIYLARIIIYLWAAFREAMAPHSSTLAWKIPWTEEPGRLQSVESLESDTTEWLHFHFSLSCLGEGNGNPLQCSCLENPRDGEAWWAAIYGVTQSRTRLKQLSSSSSSRAALLNCMYGINMKVLPTIKAP